MFLCQEADDMMPGYVICTIVVDVNPSVLNVELCRCPVLDAASLVQCAICDEAFLLFQSEDLCSRCDAWNKALHGHSHSVCQFIFKLCRSSKNFDMQLPM